MTYNSTVPATGHSASQDYSAMQGNFAQIQNSFSINHLPLASGGGIDGYHTKVFLANALGSDPNLTAPVSSIYSKLVSSLPQLFFQNGSSAGNVVQLTGFTIISSGSNYGIQTPWGLKLNWGSVNANASGSSVNFAVTFSQLQSINATSANNTSSIAWIGNQGNSGFTAFSSQFNAVYYFAIGT